MSVSIMVTPTTDDHDRRMLPVASEQIFAQYWVPAAAQLNLEFVPLFQTGLPVSQEDIPYILEELQQLRAYFAKQDAADTKSALVGRVDGLAHLLEEFLNAPFAEIFIG